MIENALRPADAPVFWQRAAKHSHYFRQLLLAQPDIGDWLHQHALQPIELALMREFLVGELQEFTDQSANLSAVPDSALKRTLRRLRQRVMASLIVRDLEGLAPLAEVVETMTCLAEVTTNFALNILHQQLAQQFGEPLDQQGHPQRLLVLGMGKLGGRELNVSSDVDFIFIYPEDGESEGAPNASGKRGRKIEAYDFFVRLGKRLIAMLDEISGDGQVFRVDMRLRPNGDSGPLVCSIVSLENYFLAQGREWERYAWIKARVINDGENLQPEWLKTLAQAAHPFIYRKYLDFGAINAMRDLHTQIRREVARKDMAEHIKLGPGGIREIEFIAQVFQLIRGGRDATLQLRPTLKVLELLAARGLLPADDAQRLISAYVFLRRLEHRLQYVNDAQTHRLPSASEAQQHLASSMSFIDWAAFLAVLNAHRQQVASLFEGVFSAPDEAEHALTALWLEQMEPDEAEERVFTLGFRQAKAMLERLTSFRQSSKYQQLPTQNRERLDAIGPRLMAAASLTKTPDATWQRGLDFFASISRRGAYLALLQQHPQTLRKVAEIIGSSAWAANYLSSHPILLDEVLDPRLYEMATDWRGFRRDLDRRLASQAGDVEHEMDILREAHHAQVFRLLAQDIAGLQTVERLADHLTQLADIIVQTTFELCWHQLQARHPAPHLTHSPPFAVIAYGKLGGKELAYGSDLDLIFLHNDDTEAIGELYTRLGQRMGTWLSSQTAAGVLFDTDFRLRPNGEAGMLVPPLAAFREYQLHKAWTWEHQALSRARFCAGDATLGAQFEAIRREVLQQKRDLTHLKTEVLAMRQRMTDHHAAPNPDFFDIKQDRGGLVDVEFIVQYLVLGYAHQHERLCGNLGNIALLGIAAELALIQPEMAQSARDAYREWRRLQHDFRLNGSRFARVERAAYTDKISAVEALWLAVFA